MDKVIFNNFKLRVVEEVSARYDCGWCKYCHSPSMDERMMGSKNDRCGFKYERSQYMPKRCADFKHRKENELLFQLAVQEEMIKQLFLKLQEK